MRGATQPVQRATRTLKALEAVLARAPLDADEIRRRREQALAAAAAFDVQRSRVAAAIETCVATLRARTAELRRPPPAVPPAPLPGETAPIGAGPRTHPTEPLPELAFNERETVALPGLPEREPRVEPPPAHWGPAERLLYEDVLALFELGDQAGAMTSLERLIMLCPRAEELASFLEKNGALLRKLYEEHLGSLDRVPVPVRDAHPVRIPTPFAPVVMDVLRLADGHRSVREILKKSRLGDVQTLASIAHLARSGFIELA